VTWTAGCPGQTAAKRLWCIGRTAARAGGRASAASRSRGVVDRLQDVAVLEAVSAPSLMRAFKIAATPKNAQMTQARRNPRTHRPSRASYYVPLPWDTDQLHGEEDFVASAERFVNIASANQNSCDDFNCYNMNCHNNTYSCNRNK